jgi:hypothetical protein
MNRISLGLAVLMLIVCGCRKSPTPVSDGQGLFRPPLPNTTTITTTLPTVTSANVVAYTLYKKLEFRAVGAKQGAYAVPDRADYFSALITASTANGHSIRVTCNWRSEEETAIEVRSDLPEAQHAVVVDHLRNDLDAAAKQE